MSGIVVKIFEVTDPPIQASEQPAGANFLADRREKAIDEKLVNGQTLHAIGYEPLLIHAWGVCFDSNYFGRYGNAEKARPLPVTFVEKTEEKPLGELLAIFKFRYFPKGKAPNPSPCLKLMKRLARTSSTSWSCRLNTYTRARARFHAGCEPRRQAGERRRSAHEL